MNCAYGTRTERKWANGNCVKIECRCPGRVEQLNNNILRSEADLHTQKPEEEIERPEVSYFIVRSCFCNKKKCHWFKEA